LNTASSDDLSGLEEELKTTMSILEERRKELKIAVQGGFHRCTTHLLILDLSAKAALPKTKDMTAEIKRTSDEASGA